jgi:predicted nucleic acid-binding protein
MLFYAMKKFRIYIDTSIIGGCEDDEFSKISLKLVDCIRTGEFKVLVSDLLVRELSFAPDRIKEILKSIPPENVEQLAETEDAIVLQRAYISAKILGKASLNDALHVAIATIAGADMVVSWNFKHIVHFDKIRMFNAVNIREGYGTIDIRSPLEVV